MKTRKLNKIIKNGKIVNSRKVAQKWETFEFNLPTVWACYLINSDDSAIDAEDKEACDEFINSNGLGNCSIDIGDDHFFGKFQGMGYDLAEYTFFRMIKQAA